MVAALDYLYCFCEGITKDFKGATSTPPPGRGEGTGRTPGGGGGFGEVFCEVSCWAFAADFGGGADNSGISQVCFISVFSKHIAL